MTIYKRNPEALYLEISPIVEKNMWTGEVELNIIDNPEAKLDEESKSSLLHLTQLVASVIPLMELDTTVTTKLENILKAMRKKQNGTIEDISNVIRVDFRKETKH
tara:strand:- start:12850 stop:13164 length:315 start_codon:yes stop_codon:yes gene_type:complete